MRPGTFLWSKDSFVNESQDGGGRFCQNRSNIHGMLDRRDRRATALAEDIPTRDDMNYLLTAQISGRF